MLTKPPGEIATRVSPRLSKILEAMVNDPERAQPARLRDVRAGLLESGVQWSGEGELEHPQDRTSLVIEVDGLISQYGQNASALEFIDVKASEGLSRIIEASMRDAGLPGSATLTAARAAMATRLVGEGGIEADQEDALLSELDQLIARYGAAAPAQAFVR